MSKQPKLTADEVLERCQTVIAEAAGRDALYSRMDKIYDQEHTESPPESNDSVVLVRLPHGTNAVDLVTDLVAQSEIKVEVPAAKETMSAKQEADRQEKWLQAWLRRNEAQQNRNLIADAAWYAGQRSVVCTKVLFSDTLVKKPKHATDSWLLASLPCVLLVRDPRHVYWAETPEGLDYVAEAFYRPAGEIKRLYPGVLDDEKYANDTPVEWLEYWDATYRAYFCAGKVIAVKGKELVPHGYGCVPYAFGMARGTPRAESGKRFRPLLAGVEGVLRALDIYASIRATAAHDVMVNAWSVFSDAYGHGSKQLDTGPDAVNYFGAQDRLQSMQRGPLPEDLAGHVNEMLAAFQQGTFPLALYGQVPGQMAGYAINMLLASGRRPMIPIYSAVQRALAGAFRLCVLICREKVSKLVGDEIGLVVTAQGVEGGSYRRELKLDTTKISDDWECTVTLSDPMPADEASNLRMALEATKGNLLSVETALTKYKVVQDATDELVRMQIERIFNRLAEPEATRLAIQRGYLPVSASSQKPEARSQESVALPTLPPGLAQPEPVPPSEQPPVPEMTPNPAVMQGMAGTEPGMPQMTEMAGQAPAGEAMY